MEKRVIKAALLEKAFLKKLFFFLLGLAFVGLGVNLIVEARLGGDSITVLYMGISERFSAAYGTSAYIYNAVIILLALLFAREYVGLGTFLYFFVVGAFVFLFEVLFARFGVHTERTFGQYVFFFSGQTVLALGLAMVISVKIGLNGLDCLILTIQKKFSFSYRMLKVLADLTITLLGFLLGGLVGVGTVLSVLTLGWMIQHFIGCLSRFEVFYQG